MRHQPLDRMEDLDVEICRKAITGKIRFVSQGCEPSDQITDDPETNKTNSSSKQSRVNGRMPSTRERSLPLL
jgi:hypothetical protein